MPDVETTVTMNEQCRSVLARLGALNDQPAMAAARRQIGVVALYDQQRNFEQLAKPGQTPWPPLGFATVIMRKGGPKIFDESDVAAKREKLNLLIASNRMYASLTPGASSNVLDVLPEAVRVGTNVEYAEKQQKGGTTTFEFGKEQEKTFRKNVSEVKRGFRRPPKNRRWSWVKRGKESPWNVFFFRVRAAFRKMAGKSYHVPARPFLIAPKLAWIAKYCGVLSDAIRKITG